MINMKKSITALIVAMFMAAPVQAQEVRANVFEISPNSDQKIDKHQVCRVVRNRSSQTLMVGTQTSGEWSVGSNSFLNNIGDIPNVTAASCQLTPRLIGGCVGTAMGGYTGPGSNFAKCREEAQKFYDDTGATNVYTGGFTQQPWLGSYMLVTRAQYEAAPGGYGSDEKMMAAVCNHHPAGSYMFNQWSRLGPQNADYDTFRAAFFACE